ncbi:hypothetical protein GCM10017608_04890 [Agromyces luteolus]|uniref:Tat pathway signal sequence domain protein n=1 Tax=Agromyces luteolus TaxID=88373 RepID=A0A7C9HPW1_9MICO|nr:hypothetical protein [Agromyces luteolus]MUN06409.1 hypothetical protein [Agromyces luteolus]GLK26557.1 hypothetical protein GCM10017608_04890 [Agromyces luteolus]
MSDLEEQRPGVSRRTVAKAAAWSVPVVALAVSTPAYAASPGIITLTGLGCKLPGNSNSTYKGYAFKASIQNTFNVPITVTITSATLGGADLGGVAVVNLDTCVGTATSFVVPANSTFPQIAIVTKEAPNSQNNTLTLMYDIDGGPGGSESVSSSVPAVPPLNGASCSEGAFTAAQKLCLASLII